MIVVIPHQKTRQEAADAIDRAAENLFAKGAGSSIAIVDPKKEWTDTTMSFFPHWTNGLYLSAFVRRNRGG